MKSKKSTNLSKKPIPVLIKMLKKERDLQQDIYEALKQRKEEALPYLEKQFLKKFEEGKLTRDLEFYLAAMGKIADSEKDLELFEEKIKDSELHKIILFYILEYVEKIESIDWLKKQYSEDLSHVEKQMFYLALARHSKDPADFREAMKYFMKGYSAADTESATLAAVGWILANGLDKLEDYILHTGWEEIFAIKKALELIFDDDEQETNIQQIKASVNSILKKALEGSIQQQKNALKIIPIPQEEYNDTLFDYLKSPNFGIRSAASTNLLLEKEGDSLKALDVISSKTEKRIKANLLSKISIKSRQIEDRLYQTYRLAEADQKFWILTNMNYNIENINRDRFLNLLKENLNQEDAFAVRVLSANILKELGEFSDDLIESWSLTEKLLFEAKHTQGNKEELITKLLNSGDNLAEPLLGASLTEVAGNEHFQFMVKLVEKSGESLIHKIIELAKKNEAYTFVAAEFARHKPTPKTAGFLIDKVLEVYTKDDEWQFHVVCLCLSYHHDYRVIIADALLPLVERAPHEYLFSLIYALVYLEQPRLLPRLMKRLGKGEVYGLLWNYSVEFVSHLCLEKERAHEYIIRVSEEEAGLKKRFAHEVLDKMEEIREEILNNYKYEREGADYDEA